jgi:hypothetical protein
MPMTRDSARLRKRVKVMLGRSASFTLDVSVGGFCTESMRVLPKGTAVKGSILVNGAEVPFAGRVAWARPGNAQLNVRGKMGVSFAEVARDFIQMIESSVVQSP